ncbi:glycosyltransferase family protein [Frigoriflavimonas asaccharolytica]|uniref:Spore protein YkvP/CgeB glycosyl transferase-like domain-containing protein n=1 Tax=Frigoriflavimonas asaccharolytica TaxID=2735899 RepID=A0A8J8K905_9FLAO|nr:hypothetical protein [Frigoriflavimonas asaccharolytica]NRS93408.1 hypothetical protein [Frigoriflavimonas asaccharolytica]
MKITVISFDFWNYDAHIVAMLKKSGVDANHINLGAYKHKNTAAKVKNALSKTFVGKNLKNIYRQELILSTLKKLGKQDQILVINPELIEEKYHTEIRKYTPKYIAYLYDSLARCPAKHLCHFFDKIFSFDKTDVQKHGFQLITNYNYLPENKVSTNTKYDLVYLASFDDRMNIANKIAEKITNFEKTYHYLIVGKKSWKKKYFGKKNPNWSIGSKRLQHKDLPKFYSQGKIILDLVRENQDGLSFRIFEAMALKKKIITNNQTIKDYDFYNPENILIINENLSNVEIAFFENDYQDLPTKIYYKYTLENWVKTVFEL